MEDLAAIFADLREIIEKDFESSRERSLAITKLDECDMWLDKAAVRMDPEPVSTSGQPQALSQEKHVV